MWFAPLLLLLCFTSGCIVYYPHTTLKAPAISGVVLDASTHAPIAGAKISRAQHPEAKCKSDSKGRFKLKKLHNWHYGTAMDPGGGYEIPEGEYWFEASVTVSHTNYLERTVDMATNHGDTVFLKKIGDTSFPTHVWLTFNGDGEILQDMGAARYLKPGPIQIIKSEVLGEPSRIRVKFVRRVYNPFVTAVGQPDDPTLSTIHMWGYVWDFDILYNGSATIAVRSLKNSSRIYRLEFVP